MKNTLSMTGSRASPDTVKELQRLGAVYEKVKDAKGLKKEQLDECRDNTANTLRELATVWHKEAQKTNNNDTYALAQYLYKEYLTRFPKEKDVYHDDLLLRRAPVQARLERRQPEVLRRGAGLHQGRRARSEPDGEVPEGSGVRRGHLVEELPLRRRYAARTALDAHEEEARRDEEAAAKKARRKARKPKTSRSLDAAADHRRTSRR